jgi:hypothetical protein
MNRRRFLGWTAAALAAALTSAAFAGSYLDRAALLLDGGKKDIDTIKSRASDRETLLVVKALTEARLKVARKMNVPEKVASAHPHLMLVLENQDRAVDALLANNTKKYAECIVNAADEERTFRTLIKQLGYTLPKV